MTGVAVNLGSEDYYRNLGVSHQATEDEIDDAYARLAKVWHPKKNPGSKLATNCFARVCCYNPSLASFSGV